MRYFIAYLIQDEAERWHNVVARTVAENCNVRNVHDKVDPHVTVYYLSEISDDEIVPIKQFIQNFTEVHSVKGNLHMNGYDQFEQGVVYAKVVADQTVRDFVDMFRVELKKIPNVPQADYPIWEPHATFAHREEPDSILKVWDYVSRLPKPDFEMPFDHIALMVYEEDKLRWKVESKYPLITAMN